MQRDMQKNPFLVPNIPGYRPTHQCIASTHDNLLGIQCASDRRPHHLLSTTHYRKGSGALSTDVTSHVLSAMRTRTSCCFVYDGRSTVVAADPRPFFVFLWEHMEKLSVAMTKEILTTTSTPWRCGQRGHHKENSYFCSCGHRRQPNSCERCGSSRP
jgi:hypothetical protein